MKKVCGTSAKILLITLINIVLVVAFLETFNPNNLKLFELDYFGKFDPLNLFPSSPQGLIVLFASAISLVFMNRFIIKRSKQIF